jgi:hypothetical protein
MGALQHGSAQSTAPFPMHSIALKDTQRYKGTLDVQLNCLADHLISDGAIRLTVTRLLSGEILRQKLHVGS